MLSIEKRQKMLRLLGEANREIMRCVLWVNENEGAFESMNLRLYDASYYMCDDWKDDFPLCAEQFDGYDFFNWFCEDSFYFFKEWLLQDYGVEWEDIAHHMGRSSNFRLCDDEIIYEERYRDYIYRLNYESMCENYIDREFNGSEWGIDYEHGLIVVPRDWDEDVSKTDYWYPDKDAYYEGIFKRLNWIVNNLYKSFTNEFHLVTKVYEYIVNFKKNQIGNIKLSLELREGEIKEERRQEEESERKYKEKLHSLFSNETAEIYEAYHINESDLDRLHELQTLGR